jgi:hypothetical protein
MLYRGVYMDMRDIIANIDTNLDDLRSGVDACARSANHLRVEVAAVDDGANEAMKSVLARSEELRSWAHDQRGAIRELRENITLLRAELKRAPAR